MLNKIWPVFIIISIIYGFIYGKIEDVNNAVFNSASEAVNLTITFFGTICLWNGIINILTKTKLTNKITALISPIINYLFPELVKKEKVKEEISMNVIANLLGLGNAATPLGLKAMKSMQEINNDKTKLSNSMVMFIVINTASLQIIPTTVMAIRTSLGSQNASAMIVPIWIATMIAAIVAVVATKLFIKFER